MDPLMSFQEAVTCLRRKFLFPDFREDAYFNWSPVFLCFRRSCGKKQIHKRGIAESVFWLALILHRSIHVGLLHRFLEVIGCLTTCYLVHLLAVDAHIRVLYTVIVSYRTRITVTDTLFTNNL